MAQTPGNQTANTFRIDADETALTLALARRIAGFSRARPRAANAHPQSRSQAGCGSLTLSTDKPAADLIGALRDALREVGIEATTLWAGTSGVEIAATMDDARIARTARMLGTLAASPTPSAAGDLVGVPFS